MAKAPKEPKAPKQPKASKAPKEVDSAAAVGPIEGILEATPDQPAQAAKPEKKPSCVSKDDMKNKIVDLFCAVEKALLDTNEEKKQPRALRWALKSLDAAKDAALRHVRHNG